MALCDFVLLPKFKLPPRGRRLESIEAIKEDSQKELRTMHSSGFEKCFEQWHKCIASHEACFGGDKINV